MQHMAEAGHYFDFYYRHGGGKFHGMALGRDEWIADRRSSTMIGTASVA